MPTKIALPECRNPQPVLCDCHALAYVRTLEVGDFVRDFHLSDPTHGVVVDVHPTSVTIEWDHHGGRATTSRTGLLVRHRPCAHEADQ